MCSHVYLMFVVQSSSSKGHLDHFGGIFQLKQLCFFSENGDHLRMHCYRAVLESIIRGKYPELVRRPVQTIKKAYNLPFAE